MSVFALFGVHPWLPFVFPENAMSLFVSVKLFASVRNVVTLFQHCEEANQERLI